METPQAATFAELLRRCRAAAGLTQEELAELAGLSPRGLLYLERNGRKPSRQTVRRLADALVLPDHERAAFFAAARLLSTGRTERPATWQPSPLADDEAAPERTAQRWVFIASSDADRAIAERLITDLQQSGIAVWLEDAGLQPGSPRWEQAVRDSIRGAGAVLLLASPRTRSSRYIPDQLRIAEMYGRPVFPVWVAGEHWLECVPLGWGGLTYIDARSAGYAMALTTLASALQAPAYAAPTDDLTGRTPEADPRNPYKGLRSFTGADSDDFFGRGRLVDTLLVRMRDEGAEARRFLAAVGPSGSGKTSTVLAGLLPRLRAGALPDSAGWVHLTPLVPGAHPLDALSIVLGRALPGVSLGDISAELADSPRGLHLLAGRIATGGAERVVIVVDQFEELFTLTLDEDARQHFIDLLVAAATEPRGATVIVVTLRADFYDKPMHYPALGALIEVGSVSVLPMTYPELRAAVEGPAALADVRLEFEDDLVGDLLFEVHGQAGALPLLQFTLDQLFEHREGRWLTRKAYQRIGGVRGALARHAEATYAALASEEHHQLARALFLRLIDPGITEQDTTRRRAAIAELLLPDPRQTALLRQVADIFIAARLLITTSQPALEMAGVTTMLEVSHEALIREWARLGGWLHEAREDIRRQHAISADSAAWSQRDRPSDYLYRGSALLEAEAWAARNTPSALETAFLAAARDERQWQADDQRQRQAAQLALAQQAAQANRRAAHRLRLLAVILAVFLGVAAILVTVAVSSALQARDAERRAIRDQRIAAANAHDAAEARVALALRNVAFSANLAGQAAKQLSSHFDLALLLSVEAERAAHTVEAQSSLLNAVAYQPELRTFLHGHVGSVRGVSFSPTEGLLASGGDDGTIRLWDVASGKQRTRPLIGHSGAVNTVAFSPNGLILASGGADHAVRLWHRDSPAGQWLSLGRPLVQSLDQVQAVAFSPDSRLLAFSSWDGTIHVWDVRIRHLVGPPLRTSGVSNVTFSPDGRLLAAAALDDRAVQLWDVPNGRPHGSLLLGHTDTVQSIAFSPDGALLASAGDDRTIRLWDVQRQHPLGSPLTGHTDRVTSLAFSPDGRILASGGADQTIRLWDVARQRLAGPPLAGHAGEVNGLAFNAGGTDLAAAVAGQAVLLWDTTPGRAHGAERLSAPLADLGSPVRALAYTHEGHVLDAGGDRGTWLWDVGQRRPLGPPLTAGGSGAQESAFSPDGTFLAVWGAHRSMQLWTQTRGGNTWISLGPPFTAITSAPRGVAFSPDNSVLAVGGDDGKIQLWDVAYRRPRGPPLSAPSARVPDSTSQVIIVLAHPNGVTSLAFSPDGKILASGSLNGTVRLWDSRTGRPHATLSQGLTAALESVAFSPDGALIATGSADRAIQLWDAARDQPLGGPLVGHTGTVRQAVFSPDGSILASGSDDGTIRLWSVTYRQPIGPPLTGQGGAITSLAFEPDGTTLAAGSADHTVRLWETSVTAWTGQACRIANRNLTRQEWRQYLGTIPYRVTCSGLPE